MSLIKKVKEVEAKYQQGNNIFRRVSVGILLERISQLEQAAQQNVQADFALPLAHIVGECGCVVCRAALITAPQNR